MAKPKKFSKARRFGGKVKRRVRAAKPSLSIAAGLGIPPVLALTGATPRFGGGPIWSFSGSKSMELINRLKVLYGGALSPNVGTIVQSDAVKYGVLGFLGHIIANLSGANRYLARMKAPFRI